MCFILNLNLCISHNVSEMLWATSDPSHQDDEEQEHVFGPGKLWPYFWPR